MSEECIVKVIEFYRDDSTGRVFCQVNICDDGSVFVKGKDVLSMYEESSDAFNKAIAYVESKGYVRFQKL